MIKEFKEFALKGNVLDLAIAVIIGAAFGKIVSSFVDNILMPPLGRITGGVDFSSLFINLTPSKPATSLAEAKATGAAVIAYGSFFNSIVDFLIIAFVLFLIVRQMNRFAKPVVASTRECPECLSPIPLAATRCAFCTAQVTPQPVTPQSVTP